MNHSPFTWSGQHQRHLREFFAEKFLREFFCKRKIVYNVDNIDSFANHANYSIHGIQGIVKHECRLVQFK